jgi:hypothetical protein
MHSAENTADVRFLTDAGLDNVNGGLHPVPFVVAGLFLLGVAIGDAMEPDLGAHVPSSLGELYASW